MTVQEALAQAARDFYSHPESGEYCIPDGTYLRLDPLNKPLALNGQGWSEGARRGPHLFRVVTDMYGSHPTVIGVIYGNAESATLEWQDL